MLTFDSVVKLCCLRQRAETLELWSEDESISEKAQVYLRDAANVIRDEWFKTMSAPTKEELYLWDSMRIKGMKAYRDRCDVPIADAKLMLEIFTKDNVKEG